jgi:hypothetical protein
MLHGRNSEPEIPCVDNPFIFLKRKHLTGPNTRPLSRFSNPTFARYNEVSVNLASKRISLRNRMSTPGVCFVYLTLVACSALHASNRDDVRLPEPGQSVILLILDNSASLPPLDPQGKRRAVLDRIIEFLNGQPYRLVLFGGRQEIAVDAPDRYVNDGKWTDFYFAFKKVQEIVEEYPEGTDFKMILLTDGIVDPIASDWQDQDVPPKAELRKLASERTLKLLDDMGLPLYVVLVGDLVGSVFVRDMVQAANGRLLGSRYAQGVSEFFEDDGVLVRRFIYHLKPRAGLEQIAPVVYRITQAASYRVELSLATSLFLVIAMLVGVAVRSFPGAGDQEILELRVDRPVHIAVDRLRRISSDVPSWSWRGLAIADDSRQADATFKLNLGSPELPPEGFDLTHLERIPKQLIHLPLPDLRHRMDELLKSGNKEDMIEALNLDYVAPDFEPAKAERLLTATLSERRKMDPMEFLRAKIHLLHNEALYDKITGPRVECMLYGSGAERRELRTGDRFDLGRYTFRMNGFTAGGRKDYRITLCYERAPSAFWLKKIVPGFIQRILRFRRTHERIIA